MKAKSFWAKRTKNACLVTNCMKMSTEKFVISVAAG